MKPSRYDLPLMALHVLSACDQCTEYMGKYAQGVNSPAVAYSPNRPNADGSRAGASDRPGTSVRWARHGNMAHIQDSNGKDMQAQAQDRCT